MNNLPVEVLVNIMRFLDVKDIINCSEINKTWYDIINTDFVWKRFCRGGEYFMDHQETKGNKSILDDVIG